MRRFNRTLASGDVPAFNLVLPNGCEDGEGNCKPTNNRYRQFDDFQTLAILVGRAAQVTQVLLQRGIVGIAAVVFGGREDGAGSDEARDVMRDLRTVHCDIITIGQYLQPTRDHLPVARFYDPSEFVLLKEEGLAMGFSHVESGPLVRSSYHAEQQVS